jgi:uncharacterized membrane protein YphA (DoxX/SURF4 family)
VPWHLFWAYFVGFALIAASLSIATKIQVRWSGLLFGIMMFLFVAMIHLPRALAIHSRVSWTIVFREPSFAAGAWILSATAMNGSRPRARDTLITVGRVIIGIVAIFFAVEQLLHPLGMPGIPLEKEMPAWMPVRPLIGYLTGSILLVAGGCILLARKTRIAATYLGAWLLLLIVGIYGPVMIGALFDPSTAIKVEGLNYFADTLLFSGGILALAEFHWLRLKDRTSSGEPPQGVGLSSLIQLPGGTRKRVSGERSFLRRVPRCQAAAWALHSTAGSFAAKNAAQDDNTFFGRGNFGTSSVTSASLLLPLPSAFRPGWRVRNNGRLRLPLRSFVCF